MWIILCRIFLYSFTPFGKITFNHWIHFQNGKWCLLPIWYSHWETRKYTAVHLRQFEDHCTEEDPVVDDQVIHQIWKLILLSGSLKGGALHFYMYVCVVRLEPSWLVSHRLSLIPILVLRHAKAQVPFLDEGLRRALHVVANPFPQV